MLFSKNGKTVFFNEADGLGIVSTERRKSSHIPLDGKIITLKESESDGNLYALSRSGDTCTISLVQPFDTHAGSFSFTAESAFIAVKDGALFVGRDNNLSRIDITLK